MFIRTVTFFVNTYRRDLSIDISRREIKEAFEEYEVYNIRLSISPPRSIEELHERLKEMLKLDFDYFGGIGSIGVNDLSVEIIKALKHDDRLTGFISVESIEESIEAARLVKEHLYRDTAAARLLIGINPPRFSPYLPYSFVLDPSIDIGFSVAINRVADLREVASRDLGELREAIVKILSKHIPRIEALSKRLEREIDAKYLGIDVSLAPMPGIKDESVGELLYNITGSTHGILPYIYFINKTLDDLPIVFSRVGYNRVMTPLGEDHKLAELARELCMLYRHRCGAYREGSRRGYSSGYHIYRNGSEKAYRSSSDPLGRWRRSRSRSNRLRSCANALDPLGSQG